MAGDCAASTVSTALGKVGSPVVRTQNRGQRSAVEATDQALLVEVVVAAVAQRVGVTQNAVGPAGFTNSGSCERLFWSVKSAFCQALKVARADPCQKPTLPLTRDVQIVEVAGEALLAVDGDGYVVAGECPEDVVSQL